MTISSRYKLVTIDKVFNERGAELVDAGKPLQLEIIELMRSLPTYSSDESLSQYFELYKTIDFAKMSDALHLITHYGAVSQERLNNASDEKEAGKLLMRKIQSDEYLSAHSMTRFDDRLDEGYPEPIGLKDKSKWYSVASKFLTNAFKTAKVQINRLSSKLYFTNLDGERVYIEGFSKSNFVSFLEIALHTSKIFDYQIDWTNDLLVKYVTFMIEDDLFSTDSIDNDIIQFNDCYVKDGDFVKGKYDFIPRFYINFDVYDIVEDRKTRKQVVELDEFLLHLSDYDHDTVKVFLSRMSTFLLNSEKLKSNFSATINVLYGASGENGKSLFLSIFKQIFNGNDITYAGLRDFNNKNYLLPDMCQSLLVLDEDAADLQLDSAATSAIKQFTHGQSMRVRSIYEKTKTLRPRAMIIACTNHMPTAVDKSEGFNRRFSIFTQSSKLINRDHSRPDQWFDALRSKEAIEYLLSLLILAHLDNMKRRRLLEHSAKMKEINEDFVEKNDSAVMYVRSVGLKEIVGKPVKIVRENYEHWCEVNGVTALKSKFNTTLESKFNLKAKTVNPASLTIDPSDLLVSGLSSSSVRAWVHVDKDIHQKYVDLAKDESEDLYQIDLSSGERTVVDSIINALETSDQIVGYSEDSIKRKISILMNEESEERNVRIINLVCSRLKKSYETEICSADELSKSDYERYISIGKYNKSLASSLKDPRRQVLIYRKKK